MFKAIRKFFSRRFNRFYRQKRRRLILDIILLAIIVGLLITVISLQFYRPGANFTAWFSKPVAPAPELDIPSLELNYEISQTAIDIENGFDFSFTLKNKSQTEINNLKLRLVLQTENFLINKIELSVKDEGSNAADNISIQGEEISLSKLEANSDREVPLSVYFVRKNEGARTIAWRIDGEYEVSTQTIKKSWSLPELSVALKPKMSAAVYYNSPQGDQLGSGPLPPIVGLPTNFWIFINAKADSSYSDLVVSGRLAKNVRATDNSSLLAGNLNFSPDSRQAIWRINKIDATSGLYRAAFEVQLIPSSDQLNSNVNLIENLKWQAKDEISGLLVTGYLGNLDTSLKADLINQGLGKVSSPESLEPEFLE